MTSLASQIDERGLMVFDNVNSLPVYNEPIATTYMVISLNLDGWVRAECDMHPVFFKRHDVAVLPPRHILCARESSPDYRTILIVMSVEFQEERKRSSTNIYRDNFYYLQKPHMSLSDEQFAIILQMFRMVQFISHTDSPNRWDMLGYQLDTLFLLLQDFRRENGADERRPSPHDQLFANFYHAVTENFTKSREVRYYAEMFHLSPKHFAAIIKQHTKTNALEWINGYTIIRAKMLLRYQLQLTVQEVAIKLGFTDQATFSRFFKSHVGKSPSDYRAGI